MVLAETRLRVPALGASVAGAPVALGGAGGPPAAVGAPPVATAATALPGRIAKRAVRATVKMMPTFLGRAPRRARNHVFLSFDRLRS